MLTAAEARDLLLLEWESRQRARRKEDEPRYDWYGPPCGCPETREDGSCPVHPRARANQRPPEGDWENWLILAGRGFGKTRSVCEWIRDQAFHGPKNSRWALVGQQASDVRDIIIEGESGILAISPPWFMPKYYPSKRRLVWPNGAMGFTFSSQEPGQFRGPQFHGALCVAKGTMIATGTGDVPIESVRVGDMVWTRAGLRPVIRSGLTAKDAEVFRITTEDGQNLRLTGNHRVLVDKKGWLKCENVTPGDMIFSWKTKNYSLSRPSSPVRPPGLSGKVIGGIATRTGITRTGPGLSCTPQSGSESTATRSRTDSSCITRTRTSPTMSRRTSSSCPSPTIPGSTWRGGLRNILGVLSSRARSLASGSPGCGRADRSGRSSVPVAASSSSPTGCGPNTATLPVLHATAVLSVEPSGPSDVYDLTVEGQPEFIADSILVHNCDEAAKWENPDECYDNLQFGMRLGRSEGWTPRAAWSTTPMPIPLIKMLLKDPKTVVSRGSTFENAMNLAKSTIERFRRKYEGTRLGRQELYAEVLEDVPGALWNGTKIEELRVDVHPDLIRVVVGVDPAGSGPAARSSAYDEEKRPETGIVVAGRCEDDHYWVLEDLSLCGSPNEWGRASVDAYHRHQADRLAAETNFGGDMVESTITTVDPDVAFKKLWASRGKVPRAEPIAALYEQNRVHHVGFFPELENQMCSYVPGMRSPDRMDALVWAITELQDSAPGAWGDPLFNDWRG